MIFDFNTELEIPKKQKMPNPLDILDTTKLNNCSVGVEGDGKIVFSRDLTEEEKIKVKDFIRAFKNATN